MVAKTFGVSYPAAAALTGTETLSIVQGGVMVDTTTQAIAALGSSAAPPSVTYTVSTTAVLNDAGKFVRMNVAGANTFTVPPNSSVAFPVDTEIQVRQVGAGATTIVAGSGVTLTKPASQTLVLKEQYSVVTLKKDATDTWAVFGHLT